MKSLIHKRLLTGGGSHGQTERAAKNVRRWWTGGGLFTWESVGCHVIIRKYWSWTKLCAEFGMLRSSLNILWISKKSKCI